MYAYLYNVFMAINMFEIEMGLRRTIIIHKRRVHIFPYECGSHSAAIYYHMECLIKLAYELRNGKEQGSGHKASMRWEVCKLNRNCARPAEAEYIWICEKIDHSHILFSRLFNSSSRSSSYIDALKMSYAVRRLHR